MSSDIFAGAIRRTLRVPSPPPSADERIDALRRNTEARDELTRAVINLSDALDNLPGNLEDK